MVKKITNFEKSQSYFVDVKGILPTKKIKYKKRFNKYNI